MSIYNTYKGRLRIIELKLGVSNAYSWVTGWKPSAVFKLVNSIRTNGVPSSSLVELTQEHMRKVEVLRVKIRLEEEKVEREMERQQVAVVDMKMAELVRLVVRVKNGEQVRQVEGLVEVALKGVMAGQEKVMKAANCARLRTLKGVLDVLSPLQCVEFLARISMLQIQLR
ncbi:protein DOG1-like 4 [Hevea brasiliensis]|uniref:protein DOG1-like 4 n=1 Tax=Hevea brasiliensis TaxID=3981 RepID=UPI0025E092F9|nr:protein DOG1-like 4 [Hevea brasiliensis]